MHLRLVSIFAAVLLVAACETTPEDTGGSAGTGAASEDSTTSSPSVTSEMTDEKEMMEEADLGPTQEGLIAFAGDRVFFDFDKYNVKPEGQRALERQAEWLARYPNVSLTIEGHCDERGTREYNLALGERRAQSSQIVPGGAWGSIPIGSLLSATARNGRRRSARTRPPGRRTAARSRSSTRRLLGSWRPPLGMLTRAAGAACRGPYFGHALMLA